MLTQSSSFAIASLALALTVNGCTPARNGPAADPQPAGAAVLATADSTGSLQLREKAAAVLVAVASVQTTDATDPADNALRANAIEGLLPMPGRLEPILRSALTDKSIGIRSIAAMAAGKAKVRALVESLQPLTTDESRLVRAAAVFGLQRNGAAADPNILASMLASDSAQERALAAFILGELGNKSAVPMLLAASAAPASRTGAVPDKLMRLQIAEALLKLGKGEAIDEVRAALYPSRSEDIEATALAVQILGQVRDSGSRAQLRNLSSDRYDSGNPMPVEIRLACAASLARMGDQYAVSLADGFVNDKSPAIRAQAAAVYGETRDAKYLTMLSTLLSDTDKQVRISAAAAIVKITDAPR